MRRFGRRHTETGIGTAFRDVLFNVLGVLAIMVVILIMLPKKPEEESREQDRSRGNIRVEVFWPNDIDADIDLWGSAPGLPSVGYSNMSGVVLNLVRDDLGNYADISGINYEVMFSRGLPPGNWFFNLHWYGSAGVYREIPVRVIITYKKNDGAASKEAPKQIIATTVILRKVHEEITIVGFSIDAEGNIIPGSMNSRFRALKPSGDDNDDVR